MKVGCKTAQRVKQSGGAVRSFTTRQRRRTKAKRGQSSSLQCDRAARHLTGAIKGMVVTGDVAEGEKCQVEERN